MVCQIKLTFKINFNHLLTFCQFTVFTLFFFFDIRAIELTATIFLTGYIVVIIPLVEL